MLTPMSDVNDDTNGSLTYILSSTYKRCQILSRALDESQETNKALQDENQRLRQELRDARIDLNNITIKCQHGGQLQELFEQLAKRQLEVDSLKEELKNNKLRREEHSNRLPSLSCRGLDAPEARSTVIENQFVAERVDMETVPITKRPLSNIQPEDTVNHTICGKRKRACGQDRNSFPTISTSIPRSQQVWELIRKHHNSERQLGNVSSAAEDGEDYGFEPRCRKRETNFNSSYDSSAPQRLDSLLSRPTPSRVKLSTRQCKGSESSIQRKETPVCENSEALTLASRSQQMRSSGLGSRKISDMRTSSRSAFKWTTASKDDVAVSRTIIDKHPVSNSKSISALSGSNEYSEAVYSNDLLVRFMGPGSEETIARMTPLARRNLLHEARTAMRFSTYEKENDLTTRAQSPPGYWNVDMPDTQEAHVE